MTKSKIALFGGTFDPIHRGHIITASEAVDRVGIDELIFVPTRRSPLKIFLPRAGDDDRLKMISLAIGGNKKFKVSDYELKKTSPCYTLETVRHFQKQYGDDAVIYWLAGADIVDELPLWYGAAELIDECNLTIMSRPGSAQVDFSKFEDIWGAGRIRKLQQNVIETSLVDISSAEIRSRLAAGEDASDMLDARVAEYIFEHGLYGTGGQRG